MFITVTLALNLYANENLNLEDHLDQIEKEMVDRGSEQFVSELLPLVLIVDDLLIQKKFIEAKSINKYISAYDLKLFEFIEDKISSEEQSELGGDFTYQKNERSPVWGFLQHREMYENKKCAVSCIGGAIGGAFTGASGGVTGVVFGAVGGAIMGCTGGCVDDSTKDDDKKDKDPKKKDEKERVKQDDEEKNSPMYELVNKKEKKLKLKDHLVFDNEGEVTTPPRINKWN